MLIPVIAAVAGAVIFLSSGSKEKNAAEPIETAKAVKGDLRLEVMANGAISPDIEVIVKGKAGGEIIEFPFNEGDLIKKGETVVKLDPGTEEARANQSEASMLMAKAKLDKARITLKDLEVKLARQKKLFEDGIISRQEFDDAGFSFARAGSDINIAEAELRQTREALKEAQERLADTSIKAPFTGTILKKFVDRGQVISSTLSSASEGTQIFSMANLDNIYVNAQIDEVDISRISPGQEVLTSVDSLPGKVFAGKVERVAPQGKVERTVTIFEVIVKVTDKDKALLRPGMNADVSILTELLKEKLLVPKDAVKTKDKKTGVYVLKAGKPEFVPVSTGQTDGVLTVVNDGIDEGAEVVTSGLPKPEKKKQKKNLFF